MLRMVLASVAFAAVAHAATPSSPHVTAADTKSDGSPQVGQVTRAVTNIKDDEIARILVTLNNGEVANAETAKAKTTNDDVRSYADMMINEHQKNTTETQALASKYSIAPKESKISRDLQTEADKAKMTLSKANSNRADRVFLSSQIEMHEKALKLLDSQLIPSVRNPELKSHLVITRESVAAHLDHARQLSKKL